MQTAGARAGGEGDREGATATRGEAERERGVWITQKSLHLHVMMLILCRGGGGGGRGEQLNSVGSGGVQKQQTYVHCREEKKKQHVGATLSHVSGSRVWQSFFTLKWNHVRPGLRSKV